MFFDNDTLKRFSNLLLELRSRTKFSDDWWLRSLRENQNPSIDTTIERLDDLFSVMGDKSWNVLKKKLIDKFPNENKDRGKNGFFNTVNEAYAYKYLFEKGYDDIEFVEESDKPTPDLRYTKNGSRATCEVKTISTSDDEIRRTNQGSVVDIAACYSQLSKQFLDKLSRDVVSAEKQISEKGVVFVIVRFDDFTNQYLQEYICQIKEHLSANHKQSRVCVSIEKDGQSVPIVEHNVPLVQAE